MTLELLAELAPQTDGKPPEWIMYAPAGAQTIHAKLNGKPSKVKITVDQSGAEALQRDLDARKSEGGPPPFFDLHHDAREAAAYPEAFEWRENGIWARVRWTPAGLEATKHDLETGTLPSVRYFSPRCAVASGRIVGLLPAESGNAAGGLVSDPAFVRIAPLVASKNPTETTMDKMRLMKMLGLDESAEMDDEKLYSELESAFADYKKMKGDMPAMQKEKADMEAEAGKMKEDLAAAKAALETAQTELQAAKASEAESFVQSLVASGKVPPKAEGVQRLWRSQYLADSAAALEASKELVAGSAAPLGGRITDDGAKQQKSPEEASKARLAKANELLASKQARTFEHAWELAEKITA
jgi:hypothetical protein